MLRHLALDFLDRDLAFGRAQDIGQAVLRQFHRDLVPDKRGESVKPGQRAFEHADVRGNAVRQEFQHALGHFEAGILLGEAVRLDCRIPSRSS